ncbi:hypothetical protein BASA60_007828 [Batrachochytrium salamandrivorans]|nr:hypothetical protein BASA60_007828 [Batrachochytrium salamandrivorans]
MGAAESSIAANYRLYTLDGNPTTTAAAYNAVHGGADQSPGSTSSPPASLLMGVNKSSGGKVSIFRIQLSMLPAVELATTLSSGVGTGTGRGLGAVAGGEGNKRATLGKTYMYDMLPDGINKLRTIRHPGIIKFVSAESRDGNLLVVTEYVQRISTMLPSMCAEEVCLGIYNILKTIDFLHSSGMCHNHLSLSSIYLTEDRRWVIGDMEFVREKAQMTPETISLLHAKLKSKDAALEDTKEQDIWGKDSVFSMDCYATGHLISDIIRPYLNSAVSNPESHSFLWDQLEESAELMRTKDAASRPSIKDLLSTPFFKNSILIEIVEKFLKEIRVISPDIKIQMFSQLYSKLYFLPQETVNTFLLPMFLNHELFAEPGAFDFFTELLSPASLNSSSVASLHKESQPIITCEAYSAQIVPFIRRTFSIRQFETRLFMLKMIDKYVDFTCDVDDTFLEAVLIPELIVGMDDVDDEIYLYSVCGLAKCISRYYQLLADRKRNVDIEAVSFPNQELLLNRGIRDKRVSTAHQPRNNADAPETSSTTENIAPAYLQRQNSVGPSLQNPPGLQKGTSADVDNTPEYSMQHLVEDLLIPHALRICISESIDVDGLWLLLDQLASLWKRLIVLSEKPKHNSTANMSTIRSLFKCLHLILRILPVDQKIEYFCHRLCGNLGVSGEASPSSILWIPKLIELSIPFLKDDSRDVRRHISASVMKMLAIISSAFERAPSIARKREQTSLSARLCSVYGNNLRVASAFPKSGPRQMSISIGHANKSTPSYNSAVAVNPSTATSATCKNDSHSDPHLESALVAEPNETHSEDSQIARNLLGSVITATSFDEHNNVAWSAQKTSPKLPKSEDGWNSSWDPVADDEPLPNQETLNGDSLDVGVAPDAPISTDDRPVVSPMFTTAASTNAALLLSGNVGPNIISPAPIALSSMSIQDIQEEAPSIVGIIREKYVKRDVIKQKRQEKHAENLRRQSLSPLLKSPFNPNISDQVAFSPSPLSSLKPEKILVTLFNDRPTEIDYFKDMTPSHVRKKSTIPSASSGLFSATLRASEILPLDIHDYGSHLSDMASRNRMSFQGSTADASNASLGWDEEFDEDIDLDDVQL